MPPSPPKICSQKSARCAPSRKVLTLQKVLSQKCSTLMKAVFFPREPQKYAREHFHKSVREYFACAREYKNENVPVNLTSAREQSKKCP